MSSIDLRSAVASAARERILRDYAEPMTTARWQSLYADVLR
jgi:hypothetical protein